MIRKNRNIQIISSISELKNELCYSIFDFKKYFIHLCDIIPNKESEKLSIEIINKELYPKAGLVYALVIKGKVFKIGHTITTIKKRVQSYNCGKVEYRISGSNSTTNYFILQSLLKINEAVTVYAYFPIQPEYEIFNMKYKDSFPPAKRAEKIILESLKMKPIGCTQK